MNLVADVATSTLELAAQYSAYDHIANLALDLDIDPASLLTFGLTALTVSQLLQKIPLQYQHRLPFVANTLPNQVISWTAITSISAVFGKYVTDTFTSNPISWMQTASITTSRFVIFLTHCILLNFAEEANGEHTT